MDFQTIGEEQLRFQRELLETRITRVVLWSAISHGAALVAFTNMIGNVPKPDHAFQALAPALLCFGAGLAASGWLGEVGRRTADIGKAKAKFLVSFGAVLSYRTQLRRDRDPQSGLQHLYEMLRLAGADPVDPGAVKRIFADPKGELLQYSEKRRRALRSLKRQSRAALGTSILLFGGGFIYIFVALGLGHETLQPPENSQPIAVCSPAKSSSTALSTAGPDDPLSHATPIRKR